MLRGISNSTMKKKEVLNITYIFPFVNTFLSRVTTSSHFTKEKLMNHSFFFPFKMDIDANAGHHPLSYKFHLCMQLHLNINNKLDPQFLLVYPFYQVEHFAMYA
jgi:hypothetical protein